MSGVNCANYLMYVHRRIRANTNLEAAENLPENFEEYVVKTTIFFTHN